MDTQYDDDIIIGGGKAGKTLATALTANGWFSYDTCQIHAPHLILAN
jgi:hypothetical protein